MDCPGTGRLFFATWVVRKLTLFITILLWSLPQLHGRTLHSIIFANTANTGIGKSVDVDRVRMGVEIRTIARSIGYDLREYHYHGSADRFNPENLDKVLDNLACAPDDIVFFYYSGHGTRAEDEETQFPEMCLYPNSSDFTRITQLYPLFDVYRKIRRRNPRLAIVMGDLCNSVWKNYHRADFKADKRAHTVLSKGTCGVYRNLFLNARGGAVLASSEPGFTSSTYSVWTGDGYRELGGYMTYAFLGALQDFVDNDSDVSWADLLDSTVERTKQLTSDNKDSGRPPQVPIYQSEISAVTEPVPVASIVVAPQQPAASDDVATDHANRLAYALSMVCNSSVPLLDRIHNIPAAKALMAGAQTRVQVIGCDGRTVVNTCSADSYLNYLSVATAMDQVVVLDLREDSAGKVSYMKVHEIHYQ